MLWSAVTDTPGNLENSAMATELEKVSFHSNPKECSNDRTIALISHASKVMLKFLQAFNSMWTENFQMLKLDLEKVEETGQIASIHWIIEKAREFQKNIYFCFIDYAEIFDCVDHKKLWKILQEMRIPGHLTCLLRNL